MSERIVADSRRFHFTYTLPSSRNRSANVPRGRRGVFFFSSRLVAAEQPHGQTSHSMVSVVVAPVSHHKPWSWFSIQAPPFQQPPPRKHLLNLTRTDSLPVEPFVKASRAANAMESFCSERSLLLLPPPPVVRYCSPEREFADSLWKVQTRHPVVLPRRQSCQP